MNPDHPDNSPPDEAQTLQTWRRYASVMAEAQGYALDEAQLERVAAQLVLVSRIAAPLLAIQLPAETEPAPVYVP